MCRAKTIVNVWSVLHVRHREFVDEDLPPHFLSKSFHKKIEYTGGLEYTHTQLNRRDASFSACVCKNQRFRSTSCG